MTEPSSQDEREKFLRALFGDRPTTIDPKHKVDKSDPTTDMRRLVRRIFDRA
jgi:hypothetical protein